jgi:hypothetical protein
MQPYFFPYLGYFDLIARVDRWIVFDTPQYIRHGWVNRNRILHPTSGWQYVIVPLRKHAREAAIREIEIHADDRWKKRLLGQLEHYRRRAPFFRETMELLTQVLDGAGSSLAELNVATLAAGCRHLEIPFEPEWFSRMDLDLPPIDAPGEWALEIAAALGASEYVNPPGGAGLFDRDRFEERGIRLTLQSFEAMTYDCAPYSFEPNLSILDVMMWASPSQVREHLGLAPSRAV